MLSAVHDAIIIMKDNILARTADVDLQAAIEMERKIDEIRDRLRERHYIRLEDGIYHVRSGIVYLDLLNRLEKIGDHIMNVSEAAAGKKFVVSKVEGTLPPVRKEAKSKNQ